MDDEAKGWPLAAPRDLERLGYLQLDLYLQEDGTLSRRGHN
jgi:hypothetical protein